MKIKYIKLLLIFFFYCQCKVSASSVNTKINTNTGWWKSTVFYQIYIRSFMDSNADGIGDLKGIEEKSYYLTGNLNVTRCLSSLYDSPNFDWGNDVSDFYKVHPEYGSMDDFDSLIRTVKKNGERIVLDLNPNHVSIEHKWFLQSLNASSPYANWFIWADGVTDSSGVLKPPNNWLSVYGDSAWEYRAERNKFYLHQFYKEEADLNYRNPVVVDEMKNVMRFWLKRGVAGFKIIAVNHLFEVNKENFGGKYPDEPKTGTPGIALSDYKSLSHIYTRDLDETYWMVYGWRKVFDEISEQDGLKRVLLTEAIFADTNQTMRYYGNETNEGAHLPINVHMMTVLKEKITANDLKSAVDDWIKYTPEKRTRSWMLRNHDSWRLSSRFGDGLVDGLNMLLTLLPGVPLHYMGDEIGMTNNDKITWEESLDPHACSTNNPKDYLKKSRDPARTPFQWDITRNSGFTNNSTAWLPVNSNYLEINTIDKDGNRWPCHYYMFQRTNIFKITSKTLNFGTSCKTASINNSVFAILREYENGSKYLFVMNMENKERVENINVFDGIPDKFLTFASDGRSGKIFGSEVEIRKVKLFPYESLLMACIRDDCYV